MSSVLTVTFVIALQTVDANTEKQLDTDLETRYTFHIDQQGVTMENNSTTDCPRCSKFVCPRCLGYIPNNTQPGAYPGAISRIDNDTEVCSDCGMEEAIVALIAIEQWPISVYDDPVAINAMRRYMERLMIDNGMTSEESVND
jgi:hypothetical protein